MKNSDELKKEIEIKKNIDTAADKIKNDITIQTLFESIAEGVVVVNEDGRIVFVNSRLENMFGFTKEELQGEPLNILIDPELENTHNQHVKYFFKSPKLRPMGTGMDLWAIRKNKIKFPVEISLGFIDSKVGRLALAFVNDITYRKQTELELLQKNKQLDDFAAIVAHDLKNNLNNIIGFSELLIHQSDTLDKDDMHTALKEVSRNARKMNDIIRDMLIFSRLKTEEIKLERIDMKNVLDEALERNKLNIRDFNTEVKIGELVEGALGYGPWIEEVWYNLINNAVNYSGQDSLIEIGSKELEDQIVFWIKDSGPGIDKKYHKLIFEDYSSTKREIVKGNGLGLPIVRKIIEKVNGSIEVESEVGEGTTFRFKLHKKE